MTDATSSPNESVIAGIDRPLVDAPPVDALLLVSFGGPEGPDDVWPFLERVTAGRNVPRERLAEVAENYLEFGGRSPINDLTRALLAGIEARFATAGPELPVYWGNRNSPPELADAVARMTADGRRHALAFVTSAYSSYSGCRQYREDIGRAQDAVGPDAPIIEKIRPFFDHPGFVEPFVRGVRAATADLRRGEAGLADDIVLIGTAHSLPQAAARTCDYAEQVGAVLELVAARAEHDGPARLAWQSRSGPPQVPWLEPDINDLLEELADEGHRAVIGAPIGFLSDHFEVVWDLDRIAAATAERVGLAWRRVPAPGADPAVVGMVADLVRERTEGTAAQALSALGPRRSHCGADCCHPPSRP